MLNQAALFLIDVMVGFFTILLLLRFYMQAFKVSFRNQVGAFVVQVTNWLVLPLRKVIPSAMGLDIASLLAAWLFQVLLLLAVLGLRGAFGLQGVEGLIGIVLWQALLGVLRNSIYLLIGALLLQAVLSWVNPYSPLGQPLMQLTRPFLAPIQRIIPPIANIDLSPLVAIILAQLVLMFL